MKQDFVYVVDDDGDVLGSIGFLLRELLIECRTFSSAETLIENLPRLGRGCILTDLKMPGVSGLDLQPTCFGGGWTGRSSS